MSFIDQRSFSLPSVRINFQRAGHHLKRLLPSWRKSKPENHTYLLPPPEIDKNFEFSYAGITATGRRFIVPDAKKTVIFSLGHANNAAMYTFFGKLLNKLGFNLIILELPRPENGKTYESGMGIMQGYEIAVQKGLLDKNSPVFERIPKNRDLVLLTHSSSGLAFERLTKRIKVNSQFALDNFKLVIHGGTMLDAASGAKRFNKVIGHRLVSIFASTIPKSPIGTKGFEKAWLKLGAWWSGKELVDAREDGPTWEEAKALKQSGIEHVDQTEADINSGRLQKNNPDFLKIPRLFLTGNNDRAADNKTIKLYADMIEKKWLEYDGKHCFLTDAKAPLYWIVGLLRDPKMSIANDKAIIMQPPHQQVQAQHMLPGSFDMRHEARLQM